MDRRDVSQVSEKAISKTSERPVCPRITSRVNRAHPPKELARCSRAPWTAHSVKEHVLNFISRKNALRFQFLAQH